MTVKLCSLVIVTLGGIYDKSKTSGDVRLGVSRQLSV